ncbi:hypothetical protein GQ600_1536 [Phytophthora cactorum]|nr:hypothetical protein GQ600_1536 [Phytophthora cactorum]
MSPNRLASTISHLERRRQNRCYHLLSIFVFGVHRNHDRNPTEESPENGPFCEVLQALKSLQPTRQRESLVDAKMLLLLQNEIGQIVGRRLTPSENHEETEKLLTQFAADGDCFVVSDNTNAVRKLIGKSYGDSVRVKQDPFHVITRFNEKVKSKPIRKLLCKQLKTALYDVNRELRAPKDMETCLRDVLAKIDIEELSCTEAEWNGCIESNVSQVAKGDLHVHSNVYTEGGGGPVRITSTSQLEGFHSGLKKLLARDVRAEIGLRILDVHVVQHNLAVGARYGRNPELGQVGLVTACRSALLCSHNGRGLLATSADQEFMNRLMSTPQYRSATPLDFSFKTWQTIFKSARVHPEVFKANLTRSRQHFTSIKELLMKNATALQTGSVDRRVFMPSLRLNDNACEGATGFSAEEYKLLRQLRREQKATGRSWAASALVTTVMFNLVVSTNSNSQLKLRRRSIRTLETALKTVQPPVQASPSNPRSKTPPPRTEEPASIAEVQQQKKRKTTACSACQNQRKKCGEYPNCLNNTRPQQNTLVRYFTSKE